MEWRWATQKKSEKRELVKDKWYNQILDFCWIWSSSVVFNTLKFSWMKRTCDVSKVFSQIESLQVNCQGKYNFIPKLLLRLLRFFWRTAALFRQIRTFPLLFRFCSDSGNSGIRQIVRNPILMGRWWEGRILINLCGKNNVRNCDLLQSDFFARCRTVLSKCCDFLRLRNMLLKATFKRSFWVLFGVTSAVTKKWLTIRMARYVFMRSKNMPSSQYYIIYSPPFGWSAPLYSPPKRCEQHQSKPGCVG